MELTLTAASKATGKSKSTISRSINSGRLSARRDEFGVFHIDGAELARVWGWNPEEPSSQRTKEHTEGSPRSTAQVPERASEAVTVLETKVALLERALTSAEEAAARERETLEKTVEDLRKRLDRADERAYALTHQAQATVVPPAPTGGPAPAAASLVTTPTVPSNPAPRGGLLTWLLRR